MLETTADAAWPPAPLPSAQGSGCQGSSSLSGEPAEGQTGQTPQKWQAKGAPAFCEEGLLCAPSPMPGDSLSELSLLGSPCCPCFSRLPAWRPAAEGDGQCREGADGSPCGLGSTGRAAELGRVAEVLDASAALASF